MTIQKNYPRTILITGGYSLLVNGKIVGAIGVGGDTEEHDCTHFLFSSFE